jgi:fibronectin type 3 domain-containing protein
VKHGRSIVLSFAVVALLAGCGKSSSPTSVSSLDTTPPPAPTNLRAVSDAQGHFSLTWSPSTAADLAGYEVWQSVPGSGTFTLAARVTEGSCPLPITAQGTDKDYRVRAYDTTGNRSAYSSTLAAETPPYDPTIGHRPGNVDLPISAE